MTTGHKEQKPSIWVHGTVAEGYNTTIVSEEMEKPYAAPRRVDDLSGHGKHNSNLSCHRSLLCSPCSWSLRGDFWPF